MMQSPPTTRVPVLDGVRGLAILLVVTGHICYAINQAAGNFIGASGVSVFFVLSGYLITKVMLADELKCGRVRLGRFYYRRALRILPGLFGFLTGLRLLVHFEWLTPPSHETWMASLLYFRNISGDGWDTGHLWSLSLEEQFYALWPVALLLLRGRRARLAAIVAVSILMTVWRLAFPHPFDAILHRPDLRLDTFLIGAAFGLGWQCTWTRPVPSLYLMLALFGWTVFAPGTQLGRAVLGPVEALMIGILIDRAVRNSTALTRVLSLRTMTTMGVISYSVYLWQEIFLGPHLQPWSVPALAVAAYASYRLIERPFLMFKDRSDESATAPLLSAVATPIPNGAN